jgi:hypothetical protein
MLIAVLVTLRAAVIGGGGRDVASPPPLRDILEVNSCTLALGSILPNCDIPLASFSFRIIGAVSSTPELSSISATMSKSTSSPSSVADVKIERIYSTIPSSIPRDIKMSSTILSDQTGGEIYG